MHKILKLTGAKISYWEGPFREAKLYGLTVDMQRAPDVSVFRGRGET
jgi:hypothetical protein